MALFLDSANPEDARQAQKLGFISGITTNPHLMKLTNRPDLEVLEELVEIFDGHVFYHLTKATREAQIDEAWQAYDLRPDRVVVKLPVSTENLSLICGIGEIDVAVTAVFDPMQAYAAAESGVHYVIVYLNKANEWLGEGLGLIAQIVTLLKPYPATEVLVRDIHSLEQAQRVLQAEAHHVSLPLGLLLAIGNHPLSERAKHELR